MLDFKDRDNYVTIVWNNIISGQEHNFNKYDSTTATTLGFPYELDFFFSTLRYFFNILSLLVIIH